MISKLIINVQIEPDTLDKIRKQSDLADDIVFNFMVFQVDHNKNIYYCCLSGGELRNGEPYFSLIGQASMEALLNVPIGDNESLLIKELKIGKTPLKEKIKRTLSALPNHSKICFMGDLQGELDGLITRAFNIKGLIDQSSLIDLKSIH